MASKNWDVWSWNNLLHLLGGMCIGTLPWLGCALVWRNAGIDDGFARSVLAPSGVLLATCFGFAREWWQHRNSKQVWTKHRFVEAIAWSVGSLPSIAVPFVISVRAHQWVIQYGW